MLLLNLFCQFLQLLSDFFLSPKWKVKTTNKIIIGSYERGNEPDGIVYLSLEVGKVPAAFIATSAEQKHVHDFQEVDFSNKIR